MTCLASASDISSYNIGPLVSVMVGLIVIMGIVSLVVRVISDTKTLFRRVPPLGDDVRQIEARVARLEVAMERLATKHELDEKFLALDAKRSRDTSDLHKHVESTASNFNRRLNDVSTALGDEIKRLPA